MRIVWHCRFRLVERLYRFLKLSQLILHFCLCAKERRRNRVPSRRLFQVFQSFSRVVAETVQTAPPRTGLSAGLTPKSSIRCKSCPAPLFRSNCARRPRPTATRTLRDGSNSMSVSAAITLVSAKAGSQGTRRPFAHQGMIVFQGSQEGRFCCWFARPRFQERGGHRPPIRVLIRVHEQANQFVFCIRLAVFRRRDPAGAFAA